jgi:hypothetical protein
MYYSDRGFWISPEGKVYKITEHFSFIKQNPALFGLSEKEVEPLRHDRDRAELLRDTMKKGWIRIRERRGETSIELWALNASAKRNIDNFLNSENYWDSEIIFLSILKDGYTSYLRVKELKFTLSSGGSVNEDKKC